MKFSQTLVLILTSLFWVACGAQVKRTENKQFVLAVSEDKASFKPLLKQLVQDYNQHMGFVALEFSDDLASANSPVLITKGLENRDGKVGWGQWFSQTERRNMMIAIPGAKTNETVTYRMQVEFDEDFLTNHMTSQGSDTINLEIRKLFAHEVGHGLQLDHVEDVSDVMYRDIAGVKNFESYWPRARAFFE